MVDRLSFNFIVDSSLWGFLSKFIHACVWGGGRLMLSFRVISDVLNLFRFIFAPSFKRRVSRGPLP